MARRRSEVLAVDFREGRLLGKRAPQMTEAKRRKETPAPDGDSEDIPRSRSIKISDRVLRKIKVASNLRSMSLDEYLDWVTDQHDHETELRKLFPRAKKRSR